jgi:two-component system, LytTR family, response regulator
MVSIFSHQEFKVSTSDKIVVNCGRKIYHVDISTIGYIESCNYYALVHTKDKTYITRQTLDEFTNRLEPHSFLRIHRSILINLNIFQCMERENKGLVVRTTIGKTFKVSRYRQKVVRTRVLE